MRNLIRLTLLGTLAGGLWGQSIIVGPTVKAQCSASLTVNCTPQVSAAGAYIPAVPGAVVIGTIVLGPKTIGAGDNQLPAAASCPSCITIVTDALTAGSATGGGSAISLLRSNGSAWVALSAAGAMASTDLSDTAGLVRGAAGLTTNNKLVEVSTTDGTIQEVSNQTANYLYGGPVSGNAAAPTFRALVSADIPANAANTSGKATTAGAADTVTNGVTASSNITDLYSVIGDGGAKGVKVGPAIATAATASTIAERNASGEVIAANTVATGKTPVATDSTGFPAAGSSFTQTGTGAVARTVDAKLKDRVSVKDFGAVGNGSTDDYAKIVAAAAVTAGSGTCLYFPSGTYAFATPLVFASTPFPVCITADVGAEIGATLKYTGGSTTTAVTFGGAAATYFQYHVSNLTIDSNSNATNGVLASHLVDSDLSHLFVINVSGTSLLCADCVNVNIPHLNVSGSGSAPLYGLTFDSLSGDYSADNTVSASDIGGTATAGVWLKAVQGTTIIGGTSEGNAGAGVLIAANSIQTKVIGFDVETNGTFDYDISGSDNHIGGVAASAASIKLRSGANGNTFTDALVTGTIVIDSGALDNVFQNMTVRNAGDPFTDNGTGTIIRNVYNSTLAARHADVPVLMTTGTALVEAQFPALDGAITTSAGDLTTALAAKYKTFTKSITVFDPVDADSGRIQFLFPYAVTVTKVWCSVKAATSVAIDLDERAMATPDTAGTAVLTGVLTCGTNSANTTSFGNAGIAANVPVALLLSGTTGTPNTLRVFITYTID